MWYKNVGTSFFRFVTKQAFARRQPADHVSWPCQRCVPVGIWILTAAPIGHTSATAKAAKTVVHALISSHLDYCNSLLFGISDNLLRHLQHVLLLVPDVVSTSRPS